MPMKLLLLFLISTASYGQQFALRQIAAGLTMPVAITHAGDSRIFITQQRGQILIYDGTRMLPTPFLDIQPLVLCCGERGLLSVAFHPRYRDNGLFYVYYVNTSSDVTIARYKVSSDPNRADTSSAQILLTIDHRDYGNHNGGQLQFGPDGYLYAGTGDGGGAGDPLGNGQNVKALLGKMLRLDVDSGSPYAIPPSNPFANRTDTTRKEIWAYGLRNPWRFSFDRMTGDLWIADVGQDAWEEIDLQSPASIGGENYGWNRMEGKHCYPPGSSCDPSLYTLPLLEYDHSAKQCSLTGGYRYRGARFPRLQGLYVYGDYCTGTISAAQQEGTAWTTRPLVNTNFAISTFGEDMPGELYVADYQHGVIYQIVDNEPFPPKRRVVAKH